MSEAIDMQALVDQVKDMQTAIAEMQKNHQVIADTLAAQKIPSAEDVAGIVAARLDEFKKQQATTAAAAEGAAALKAKREAFAAEHLSNVPKRYHADLGDDEAKWPEAVKAIREAFATEFKAAGMRVQDVGGSLGGSPVGPVYSCNPTELVAAGLAGPRPQAR